MNLLEHVLERRGCAIHYWLGGDPTGPSVVFTHGATIDHHEWDATLPIVGQRYRVLAWDVRGHGLSRPAPLVMAEAVEDLLAILDRHDVAQATLVGHSMGGNLHQEFVFHHPDRVASVVCVGCTWNFQKLSPWESLMLRMVEPILKVYPYQWLRDQSVTATATSTASQDLLRAAMGSLTKDEFIQITMATTYCLHYEPGYKIDKPLLLMVGDKDFTGNIRKVMPKWARQELDCRFLVIPNAKHAANLDAPDVFHEELMQFLSDRVGDSTKG